MGRSSRLMDHLKPANNSIAGWYGVIIQKLLIRIFCLRQISIVSRIGFIPEGSVGSPPVKYTTKNLFSSRNFNTFFASLRGIYSGFFRCISHIIHLQLHCVVKAKTAVLVYPLKYFLKAVFRVTILEEYTYLLFSLKTNYLKPYLLIYSICFQFLSLKIDWPF